MTLRITVDETSELRVVLRLAGRLEGRWPAFLEREGLVVLRAFDPVAIDLSGISVVDRSGVEALHRLQLAGASIEGCSDLIASILESDGVSVARRDDLAEAGD